MRLRELDLAVGMFPTGPENAITDVSGVSVGHAQASSVATGLTAVNPFDVSDPHRTYVGRWALDGGDDATGLGLAEDFGALSTPLVLAPAASVGRVYDAMIQLGLAIDVGLSEDRGWPPAVLPVTGIGQPAAAVRAAIDDDLVAAALHSATRTKVLEGQVGIGQSLLGFGCAAGVGTASRRVGPQMLGALIAVNGGEASHLSVDGHRLGLSLPAVDASRLRSAVAIVITDAPLLPQQLQRVAGRGAFGLTRVGLLDELTHAATIWALSTNAPIDEVDVATGTIDAGGVSEADLPQLFAAAAEALEEATLNALLASAVDPVSGNPLPTDGWPSRIRQQRYNG
jgi:D-aminopeptidase